MRGRGRERGRGEGCGGARSAAHRPSGVNTSAPRPSVCAAVRNARRSHVAWADFRRGHHPRTSPRTDGAPPFAGTRVGATANRKDDNLLGDGDEARWRSCAAGGGPGGAAEELGAHIRQRTITALQATSRRTGAVKAAAQATRGRGEHRRRGAAAPDGDRDQRAAAAADNARDANKRTERAARRPRAVREAAHTSTRRRARRTRSRARATSGRWRSGWSRGCAR